MIAFLRISVYLNVCLIYNFVAFQSTQAQKSPNLLQIKTLSYQSTLRNENVSRAIQSPSNHSKNCSDNCELKNRRMNHMVDLYNNFLRKASRYHRNESRNVNDIFKKSSFDNKHSFNGGFYPTDFNNNPSEMKDTSYTGHFDYTDLDEYKNLSKMMTDTLNNNPLASEFTFEAKDYNPGDTTNSSTTLMDFEPWKSANISVEQWRSESNNSSIGFR